MVCQEQQLVDALIEVIADQSWKSRLRSDLEERNSKLHKKLEEQEDILRLETDKIRGLEQNVESQIDKVRISLNEVDRELESDRILLEKERNKHLEKLSLFHEQESLQSQLASQIKELSDKAITTADLERHFPEQKYRQSLFFKVTRIVFGKTKKDRPHFLRGYVSNVSGTDMSSFEIDTLKFDEKHVRDHLWDYIADGISSEFKKFK